jgi:hypothetical protein
MVYQCTYKNHNIKIIKLSHFWYIARACLLCRGDQILSVNGRSLEGLTHQDAVSILKNCEDSVSLEILS